MGANSVKIPVELEMSLIQSQIGALRTALEGVKEGTNSYKKLNSILVSTEKRFSSLQEESKKTFSSQTEINRFRKNLENINISAQLFKDNLSQVDVKDLKIDSSSFDAAVKKVNDLIAVIDNANNAEGLFNNVKEVQSVLKGKVKINTFDGFFEAFDEEAKKVNESIDKVKKNIADLNSKKILKDEVEKRIDEVKNRNTITYLNPQDRDLASKQIASRFGRSVTYKGDKNISRQTFEEDQKALLSERSNELKAVLEAVTRLQKADTTRFSEKSKAALANDESLKGIKYELQGSTIGKIKENLQKQIDDLNAAITEEVSKIAANIPTISKIDKVDKVAREIDGIVSNAVGAKKGSAKGTNETLDAYTTRRLAAVDAYNTDKDQEIQNKNNELPNYEAALKEIENARVIVEQKYAEILAIVAAAQAQLPGAKLDLKEQAGEMKRSAESARDVSTAMEQMGGAVARAGDKAEESSDSLSALNTATNKLASIKNIVGYWLGFRSVMRGITNVVKNAAKTIRELDDVMTEISIVTDMTQEDLWKQMDTYSAIAVEYGTSIKGVYEISQLYYQQGLQTKEVMELTTETLKMAKIAGIDYATSADYMTVAIRGFKMEMSEAQRVTDVYSALAAATASDTEELAVAMSKTASSAEAVGSTFEATSAMIATMVSTTRESATNINKSLTSLSKNYIIRIRKEDFSGVIAA